MYQAHIAGVTVIDNGKCTLENSSHQGRTIDEVWNTLERGTAERKVNFRTRTAVKEHLDRIQNNPALKAFAQWCLGEDVDIYVYDIKAAAEFWANQDV